jgi:hypothetical protein
LSVADCASLEDSRESRGGFLVAAHYTHGGNQRGELGLRLVEPPPAKDRVPVEITARRRNG